MARTGWRVIAGVAVSGALLGACSSSGYHYVKSSEDHTYLKVPDGWKLYGESDVLKILFKNLSPAQREQRLDTSWQVAFDASPKPNLDKHIADAKAKDPVGIASVEELDFSTSDTVSTEGLRNYFFPIDQATQDGTGEVLNYEPVELDDGFHGIHLVANIQDTKGHVITFDQTSVVDQTTSKLYTLLITCGANCYEKHKDKIERVVNSWTVKS
jgi:hypothetical protein